MILDIVKKRTAKLKGKYEKQEKGQGEKETGEKGKSWHFRKRKSWQEKFINRKGKVGEMDETVSLHA